MDAACSMPIRPRQVSTDTIMVCGHDLVDEIIGQWSFADLVFTVITNGERPSAGKLRMTEALLSTFVDHGVTPSSLATRLTLLGSPEAMQAAIAAGLSGAGSRYLGTMQTVGEMLADALARAETGSELPDIANDVVTSHRIAVEQIPGLGHPEHKSGDPRTPKLVEIARGTGCYGEHCKLLFEIAKSYSAATGRSLPVNAAGVAGAIVLDMGLPPEAGRGLALISRAAGLVGVALSEMRDPTAQKIWDSLR